MNVTKPVKDGQLESFEAGKTLCCCITPAFDEPHTEIENATLCIQAMIPTGNFISTAHAQLKHTN